ncbi:MAG: HlyD family type I secretion periplasmic adaptor subunit [Sedimentitalea sp.]
MPLAAGLVALTLLVVGLGSWSVFTKISGAVVASGMIEVESNRQVVQHPEGGVVGAIDVDRSQVVEKGDILIRLDGRRVRSELAIVERQLHEIATRKTRLMAERDGTDVLRFDKSLILHARRNPESAQIVAGEMVLFNARRAALKQEITLLEEQNSQIRNRIEGITAQLDAIRSQKTLVRDELSYQQDLLDQQLTRASLVNELMRDEADLKGRSGQLEAEIAELRGMTAGNNIEILQLTTRRREEAVTTLRDLQFREIELNERSTNLRETLSQLDIRAPVSGVVYDLQVFALQSVVRPAEPLMYIIPQDQPLIVSARIESINVDEVWVGQEAVLVFPAFDQRKIPEIRGKIARISADVITDKQTGAQYYSAEIIPAASEIAKLGDFTLLPGMPVEAFVQTGDRTPLSYLVTPFTSFFSKAFRE